jgi:hypothetical protein
VGDRARGLLAGGRLLDALPPRALALFHEYFDGDTGRGLGASHQTGWTALVACCFERVAETRPDARPPDTGGSEEENPWLEDSQASSP